MQYKAITMISSLLLLVFSLQDRIQLINNIQEHSPKTEKHSYKVCIAKIDWSKVAFGDFSYEVCQKEWDTIQNEVCFKYLRFEGCIKRGSGSSSSSGQTAGSAITRLWVRIPKLTADSTMTRINIVI